MFKASSQNKNRCPWPTHSRDPQVRSVLGFSRWVGGWLAGWIDRSTERFIIKDCFMKLEIFCPKEHSDYTHIRVEQCKLKNQNLIAKS